MKMNCWLLAGLLFTGNLIGQQLSNLPPAAPLPLPAPPATPAPAPVASQAETAKVAAVEPAKKAPAKVGETKKKRTKKNAAIAAPGPAGRTVKAPAPSTAVTRTEPLTPGLATVVANNVNVRGQARFKGEVVTRLTKGDTVTVLEEIVLQDSDADEPSAWAKILLPSDRSVWISSLYANTNNNTTASRLNLRGGPGENYSILGRLERGASFRPLEQKGDWIKIEAPEGAYGFVAAQYLHSESARVVTPAIVEAPKAPEKAPAQSTPAVIAEAPGMAPPPADKPFEITPVEPATPAAAPAAPAVSAATESAAPAPPPPFMDAPSGRRIVQREGIVRNTLSVQAPSYFALVSPDTKRLIEYLISPSPDLDLKRFKGMRVIVTGEEGLEERWGNTPVLTVERIEVVE